MPGQVSSCPSEESTRMVEVAKQIGGAKPGSILGEGGLGDWLARRDLQSS